MILSEAAEQFKRKLAKLATEQAFTWKKPLIYREEVDTLAFDIRHKNFTFDSLVFFLSDSGKVSYLRAWGPNIWVDMEDGDDPDDDKIRSLFRMFYTGQGATDEASNVQLPTVSLWSQAQVQSDND